MCGAAINHQSTHINAWCQIIYCYTDPFVLRKMTPGFRTTKIFQNHTFQCFFAHNCKFFVLRSQYCIIHQDWIEMLTEIFDIYPNLDSIKIDHIYNQQFERRVRRKIQINFERGDPQVRQVSMPHFPFKAVYISSGPYSLLSDWHTLLLIYATFIEDVYESGPYTIFFQRSNLINLFVTHWVLLSFLHIIIFEPHKN